MTAVFYDVENLKSVDNYKLAVSEVSKIIVSSTRTLQYAYADWARLDNESRDVFVDGGINLKQVITGSNYYNSIKNAADIALSIDVMEVMFKNNNIENFILVSGDGGYISLVNKLKEYGKFVSVISLDTQLSKALEKYVDKAYTIKEKHEQTSEKYTDTSINIKERHEDDTIKKIQNSTSTSTELKEGTNSTKHLFESYQKAIWAILHEYKNSTIDNFLDILFRNYSVIDKIKDGGFPYTDILNPNKKLGIFDNNLLFDKLDAFAKEHFFVENKANSFLCSIKGPKNLEKVQNAFIRNGANVNMSKLRKALYTLIEDGYSSISDNSTERYHFEKGTAEALYLIYGCLERDVEKSKRDTLNTSNYLDIISGPLAKFLNSPKASISKSDTIEFLKYSF